MHHNPQYKFLSTNRIYLDLHWRFDMKMRPLSFLSSSLLAVLLSTSILAVTGTAMASSKFKAPKVGAPGNREAGASRSDTCASTVSSRGLTAILPTTNLGLTTQPYPTFFAYIPSNNAVKAEFRLIEEETGEEIFVGQIQMPKADDSNAIYKNKASVVRMPLPKASSAKGLEAGKNYLWALMVVCNANNRAEDIVVTGVIQRVDAEYIQTLDPETKQKLNRVNEVSDREQLSIYASAGIWHDMLADVSMLLKQNPATYGEEWKSLLSDQGLGSISSVPVVESRIEPLQP
jgi:hypothetical protein